MKIGLLLTSHPDPATSPYPHQSIHARVTDEVLTAEEHGFDSVWIAEHHFSNQYGILPDPFSYLCYLAAKTSRIKLGAAVMVVPLHHPLRIVENAAFVDILRMAASSSGSARVIGRTSSRASASPTTSGA